MRMTKSHYRQGLQRGYSLIELLIALVLGVAVLLGLSTVFVTVNQTFRFQETTGRMQEDGVFALDSLAQNLRMAGYAGCVGIKNTAEDVYFPESLLESGYPEEINGPNPLAKIDSAPEVTTQPFTPFNFIRGFDGVEDKMFAAGQEPVSGATDSLFFAGGSAKTVAVKKRNPPDSAAPTLLEANPYKWSTNNGGVYYMIFSNCDNSFIFKGEVTGSGNAESVSHKKFVLETNTKIQNGTDEETNINTSTELPLTFEDDAIVMPAEWRYYYTATRPGAKTPSLYRVFFDGNKRGEPEEIVSNVESMRIHYAETIEAAPFVAWRTCAAGPQTSTCSPVTDWSRIVSVRIGLMMVSADDNVNSGGVVLNVPTLLGLPYDIPAGASPNRQRKEFSTTINLRNRMN